MATALRSHGCATCGKGGRIICEGCQECFCFSCFVDHRQKMSERFEALIEQHDQLRHIDNHYGASQEHPLFSQISAWERDSIVKIQHVATAARYELRQLLNEQKSRTDGMLTELRKQLCKARETVEYMETDLAHWQLQLGCIQKQRETPLHVDIASDEDLSPIYLIKLKMIKEDIIAESNITHTRPNDSSKNIEISDENSPASQLDSQNIHEQKNDQVEIDFETPLDPTKRNNLILLQISPRRDSQLSAALRKLNDDHLSVLNKTSAWSTQLKQCHQSTLIVDMFQMSFKEQDDLLNQISPLKHIHSIYIRGTPPEDDENRQYFFSKYTMIKGMFESEQRLLVQWTMDTANEYKKHGDIFIGQGEKDEAQLCFSQGVALYKRLSIFLNEKRHTT